MKVIKRYLERYCVEDLQKKMVLLGGPRQVGKTTFAKQLGRTHYRHPLYLNWDDRDDQKKILNRLFDQEVDLTIFDELHKYHEWKNYLKGLYDKQFDHFRILVTGSARLDIYRRGGDSLMGRYHYLRLHPFSVAELISSFPSYTVQQALQFPERSIAGHTAYEHLFQFGGFPEPLFTHDQRTLRRWQKERLDRLVHEDIRDIEYIRQLSGLEILVNLLPEKVGSRLSLDALREDLRISHNTVSHWMEILEKFYYHFRIRPFTGKLIRSLHKEAKLYLWDWSEVAEPSARLENMVAEHLLKFTHWLADVDGYRAELFYLRDRAGHEVDFLVVIDQKPWFAVEVKLTDTQPAKNLHYFGSRLSIPYLFQVIHTPNIDFLQKDIRIISADKFLSGLI